MATIDLVCLGVGKGASYIMKGMPSTSFVIRVNEVPTLLVDCGVGIGLSYQRNIDSAAFPDLIYISHNHTDHTGDLPIVLGYTISKPRILGHPTVLDIVKKHRLHEVKDQVDNVNWVNADPDGRIDLGNNLYLQVFRSVHSYVCYGFMLKLNNQDILGYPADTAFDEDIYARVTRAPVAILDGRDVGNHDHASLEDIDRFAQRVPNCTIRVVHYEQTDYVFTSSNVRLWREGDVIDLSTEVI